MNDSIIGKIKSDKVSYEVNTVSVDTSFDKISATYVNKLFPGSQMFSFSGIENLSNVDALKLEIMLKESTPYVSTENSFKYEGIIENKHIELLRVVFDCERDLKGGKLLLIQAIVSGFINDTEHLRSIVENQVPAEKIRCSPIEYLLPSFEYFFSKDYQYSSSIIYRIKNITAKSKINNEINKHIAPYKLVEMLTKAFYFLSDVERGATWGNICDSPASFVRVDKFVDDVIDLYFKETLISYSNILYFSNNSFRRMISGDFTRIMNVISNSRLLDLVAEQYVERVQNSILPSVGVKKNEHTGSGNSLSFLMSDDEIDDFCEIIDESSLRNFTDYYATTKDVLIKGHGFGYAKNFTDSLLQITIYLYVSFGREAMLEFIDFGDRKEWDKKSFKVDDNDLLCALVKYYSQENRSIESLELYLYVESIVE